MLVTYVGMFCAVLSNGMGRIQMGMMTKLPDNFFEPDDH